MRTTFSRIINSHITKKLTAVLMICALVLPCVYSTTAATKDELNQANDSKNAIDKKLEEVQAKLDQLSKDKTSTETYIKELDGNLAEIDNAIYSLEQDMEKKTAEIEQAQINLENTKASSDEQYEAMKLRIKYMYEHNNASYLEMLVSASDMSDLLNKAEYINKITEYDHQKLEEFAATIKMIEETEKLLQEDLAAIEEMKVSVEAQKASLAVVQEAKVSELSNLDSMSAEAKAYAAQLEKDKAEQEAEIRKIEAEIKRQEEEERKRLEEQKANGITKPTTTIQTYDGGKFKWPTPSTRITSPYGDMDGRASGHQGVDIGALTRGVSGDPIYAAYSGTVVTATYSSSAGNWIWINHGNGLYTVYMHCSQLLVSVGQKVNMGDTIALMGTTGNSTGVHLHFGVRLNGSYVNPMSYFG